MRLYDTPPYLQKLSLHASKAASFHDIDFLPPTLHAITLAGELLQIIVVLELFEQRTVLLDPSAIDRPFLLQDSDIFLISMACSRFRPTMKIVKTTMIQVITTQNRLSNFNCIFRIL